MYLRPNPETILVISDTQAPFHHPDTLHFLAYLKSVWKPTKVIHIGDLLDLHNFSRFPKEPDSPSVNEELAGAKLFVKQLGKLFPQMIICDSNHDSRIAVRAASVGIPAHFLHSLGHIFKFPAGWKLVNRYEIEGIIFEHGVRTGGKQAHVRLMESYGCSVVTGHHHSNAAIVYHMSRFNERFAMAVGCLIDDTREESRLPAGLRYSANSASRPVLGTGLVVKGTPHFVPMMRDENGRWIRPTCVVEPEAQKAAAAICE